MVAQVSQMVLLAHIHATLVGSQLVLQGWDYAQMSKMIKEDGSIHPFYCARAGHELYQYDLCEKQCTACFEFDTKAWHELEQKYPFIKKNRQQQ